MAVLRAIIVVGLSATCLCGHSGHRKSWELQEQHINQDEQEQLDRSLQTILHRHKRSKRESTNDQVPIIIADTKSGAPEIQRFSFFRPPGLIGFIKQLSKKHNNKKTDGATESDKVSRRHVEPLSKLEAVGNRTHPAQNAANLTSNVTASSKDDQNLALLTQLVYSFINSDIIDEDKQDFPIEPEQLSETRDPIVIPDVIGRDKRALERLRHYLELLTVNMNSEDTEDTSQSDEKSSNDPKQELAAKKTPNKGRPIGSSQQDSSVANLALFGELLASLEESHPQRDSLHLDYSVENLGRFKNDDSNKDSKHFHGSMKGGNALPSKKFRANAYENNKPAYRKHLRETKRLLEELLLQLNRRKAGLVT